MSFNFSIRLFVDDPLNEGGVILCEAAQAHYLLNVVRINSDETFAVFNGIDGEWQASISRAGKRDASLHIGRQIRAQQAGPDLHYMFAPLKRARLDYMVQKAVELGVSRLCPIITQHTNSDRVNLVRMRANVIEAAEQCGIMEIAGVDEPLKFMKMIEQFDGKRQIIYCDEALKGSSPIDVLDGLRGKAVSVLIGPEGGFSEQERSLLHVKNFVTPISLGPRIMRADTCAVAALSLVNGVIGDWRSLG